MSNIVILKHDLSSVSVSNILILKPDLSSVYMSNILILHLDLSSVVVTTGIVSKVHCYSLVSSDFNYFTPINVAFYFIY
uniref:Uncharacterized protein n=1 Tax=Rhizophora mucronata TaxID=61149 RepID=A0A2P2JF09_RHIMU